MKIAENAVGVSERRGGTEELVPLTEIDILGIPHRTIWGWAVHGVDGVVLNSVKVGRRIYTTRAWLSSFLASVNERRVTRTRY